MSGKFVLSGDIEREQLDWGGLGWISRPSVTGAKQLTVMDVTLEPGHGHDFHKHPQQDELITVLAGRIEQWIGEEKSILEAGDSVYLDADVVHASFNVGDVPARLFVVLAPSIGDEGYELVDVASEAPWSSLR